MIRIIVIIIITTSTITTTTKRTRTRRTMINSKKLLKKHTHLLIGKRFVINSFPEQQEHKVKNCKIIAEPSFSLKRIEKLAE